MLGLLAMTVIPAAGARTTSRATMTAAQRTIAVADSAAGTGERVDAGLSGDDVVRA